jgi:hypothetical protein
MCFLSERPNSWKLGGAGGLLRVGVEGLLGCMDDRAVRACVRACVQVLSLMARHLASP